MERLAKCRDEREPETVKSDSGDTFTAFVAGTVFGLFW